MSTSSSELKSFTKFFQAYMQETRDLLDLIKEEEVSSATAALYQCWLRGSTVFVMGNGGSATNALHFANCLSQGTYVKGKKPLKAQALVDNLCTITAVSNDFGYDQAFAKQLEMAVSPRDVVVGISCSGNSPNVINAFQYARAHDVETIGFLGFTGGKMRELSDYVIYVGNSNYGQVETIHLSISHLVAQHLKELIADS